MRIEIWQDLTAEGQRAVLARPALANDANLAAQVAALIERVRSEGDAALFELTAKLDQVELESIEVDEAEFDAAAARLTQPQRAAIRAAAASIETFHRRQILAPISVETAVGVRCERVFRPIESVGLCPRRQRAVAVDRADARSTGAARGLPGA